MKKISASLAVFALLAAVLQPSATHAYGVGVPPVSGLGSRVLGSSTVSNEDRQEPDYIRWNQAPATANRIFGEVYGRRMNSRESAYWKSRARTDKALESRLRDTMRWHKSVGSYGPKLDKARKAAAISTRMNDVFASVYGRLPSKSEYRYWTGRIMDKLSVSALRGAMLFNLHKS